MAHWKINTKSGPAPTAFGPTRPPAQAEFSDLPVDTIYSFELEFPLYPSRTQTATNPSDRTLGLAVQPPAIQ